MTVSIVIPCLNEENYIERCLRSIEAQHYPSAKLTTYVVDGMSTDATRERIRPFLAEKERENTVQFHLIDNPERFTPRALNLGIQASQSDVVIILGAHAELDENFVQENVNALNRFPEAGCVGGVIENVNENATAEVIARAMRSPFGVGNARFRTGGKAGFVDTVAFGAYRREVFEKAGLFDEDLVRNQDDEFNYRLHRHGFKIYFDPKIRSKYYVRGSFSKLFRQYWQYGYWKVYVNRKHGAVTSIRQMVPFFFVAYLAITLLIWLLNAEWGGLFIGGAALWLIGALAAAVWQGTPSPQVTPLIRAFFTLHLSYGLGYAQGLWNFMLLRKKPSRSSTRSTR
jgi:GT2 family glycosyltransferase